LALIALGALATSAALLWATPSSPSNEADTTLVSQALPPAPSASAPAAAMSKPEASAADAASVSVAVAQAARIEDLAPANPAATPASAADAVPSPFDKLAAAGTATPMPADPKVAQGAKPVAKPPAKPASKEKDKATKPASATTTIATASNQRGNASPSTRTAAASPSSKPAKAGTAADADVEIMAALMSHMTESAGNGKETAGESSIADLVRHCRSLPGTESQACQRRICQGYWGRAEACPIRERPAPVRVAG
jgi:hypothetical protein